MGVAVGFAGIVLIARPWAAADGTIDLAGDCWLVASSMILGLSYIYVRRFLPPANYLAPVVALLIGWVAGERFGRVEMAASALIFVSIALRRVGQMQTAGALRGCSAREPGAAS
ncbi:hypothetical protein [Paraburkholderia sp. Tr-20389]|uniref:hypothetical protein n=1 Tax=Paraburkholderia sp. Tr-20389 TaxID=2703903 RepID=UPI00197D9AFB|nr:hypothetical protein [Paraburkholderia sp. Tr-20389]